MRLYHGSTVAISRPQVDFNTGFADLGRGFYLTDDYGVARQRAVSRARRLQVTPGVVSVFELSEEGLPWVRWGAEGPTVLTEVPDGLFGLRFDDDPAGIAAWIAYISACRSGRTEVAAFGSPAVVRAWIATEEVEFAHAGMASAAEVACVIDPSELVVQYCLTQQQVLDDRLSFVEAREV